MINYAFKTRYMVQPRHICNLEIAFYSLTRSEGILNQLCSHYKPSTSPVIHYNFVRVGGICILAELKHHIH